MTGMSAKNISQADDPAHAPLRPELNPRQRILVVEDDPDIRRLNTEVLSYFGYQVDAAEDGEAAWDALRQNNYDLIVTDNDRSEERRVGKECRSRWSPYH